MLHYISMRNYYSQEFKCFGVLNTDTHLGWRITLQIIGGKDFNPVKLDVNYQLLTATELNQN
jgi:hypothetical protein